MSERKTADSADPEVLVVGAGLAGLNAALELHEAGVDVLVLEASERVGGRILTMDFDEGPVEAGATTFGPTHKRGLALLDRFNIETNVFDKEIEFAYSVNGVLCGPDEWPESKGNRLVGDEREILPSRIDNYYMQCFLPFDGLDDWLDPQYAEYDIPFGDFLRSKGVSDEALRLVNMCVNTDDIQTVSALSLFRDALKWREVGYTDPEEFQPVRRRAVPSCLRGRRRSSIADGDGRSAVPSGRLWQRCAVDRVRRRFGSSDLPGRNQLTVRAELLSRRPS